MRKRLAHLQQQNSYVSQQNAIRTDLAQRAQNRMRNGLTAPKTQRSIERITNIPRGEEFWSFRFWHHVYLNKKNHVKVTVFHPVLS